MQFDLCEQIGSTGHGAARDLAKGRCSYPVRDIECSSELRPEFGLENGPLTRRRRSWRECETGKLCVKVGQLMGRPTLSIRAVDPLA